MADFTRGFSAPLALALLSGIALVFAFGYLFSHGRQAIPDQFHDSAAVIPAGWVSYTDQKIGLIFSYPPDFARQGGNPDVFLAGDAGDNKITERSLGPFRCKCESGELEEFVVSDAVYGASGAHPKSISEFQKVLIGGREFYKIRTERFEGMLSYSYYLPLGNKIAVFSFTARGADWTDPNLDEENDSAHLVIKKVLTTIKIL